jgi:hypothetical protein
MAWPRPARKWTEAEVIRDARIATEHFRRRRLGEPKERYLKAFAYLERANKALLGSLHRLGERPIDASWVADILANEDLKTALRYIGAPPISEDDLKTLTGDSLAPTLVRKDASRAEQICEILVQIIDPKRFPWIYENRKPRGEEIKRAILASTVAAAAQRVQTSRRTDERDAVEGAVRGLLLGAGWKRIAAPREGVKNIRKDAPAPKEFMERVTLGANGADLVVGLRDHRILAIECKGSNSEINSRKRINKEVANDAQAWVRQFGEETVVPAAAIQGVFKPSYILQAQEIPVVFFWGHRLEDLKAFLGSTSARRQK